jgi:hypothetical protein
MIINTKWCLVIYAYHTSLSRLARKHLITTPVTFFFIGHTFIDSFKFSNVYPHNSLNSIYHSMHHQLLRLLRLRFYRTYIKDCGSVFLSSIRTDSLDLIINSPTSSISSILFIRCISDN